MTIVQITDLHILPDAGAIIYGVDPFAALKAVLGAALATLGPDGEVESRVQ